MKCLKKLVVLTFQILFCVDLIESNANMFLSANSNQRTNCTPIEFSIAVEVAREMSKFLKKRSDSSQYFYVTSENWQEYFLNLDRKMNLERYVYLFAYRGWFRTSGYDVEITRVCQVNNTVHVLIRFDQPKPNQKVNPVFTFPMDAISIDANFWPHPKIALFLSSHGNLLIQQTK